VEQVTLCHERPRSGTTLAAVAEVHAQVREEQLDAEREARRALALAQIRQYPDPALRLRANEVEEFDDDLARLAERMTALMRDANGVGLAATQVGILRRVFVFQPGEDEEPVVVVNPQIEVRGGEAEAGDEGCLSMQGVLVCVERPCSVVLTAQDVAGADYSRELHGQGARVAQHELDHLDGVLMIDRATDATRKEAMAVLRPRLVAAGLR
jgi:peptide deformylase